VIRGTTLAILFAVLVSPWPIPAAAAGWPVLSGPYFGQKPPGMRAELFAPGIVSSEYHDDGSPAFSTDGRECYWRVIGQRGDSDGPGLIFCSREVNGRWTEPQVAPFANPQCAASVCLQRDGQRLYFGSRRSRSGDRLGADAAQWFVDRTPSGWSEPRPLSLSVGNRRLSIQSAGADGSLFCVPEDTGAESTGIPIYRVRRIAGGFAAPEPLGIVPTGAEQIVSAPTVSPDGNTFVCTTSTGRRVFFLMVSFRRPDGTWTAPQRLRDDINAPPQTKFASFSPDGRYLFLASDRPAAKANPPKLWKSDAYTGAYRETKCDVYWVDAKAVEALRPAKR
jgi:hypothetical protein